MYSFLHLLSRRISAVVSRFYTAYSPNCRAFLPTLFCRYGPDNLVILETMPELSFHGRILGTWRLISCIDRDAEGRETYPFGENPDGFLIYTEDGFVSAHLERRNRPVHQSPDPIGDGTPEEFVTTGRGYMAYCGRYTLEEDRQRITHTMTVSLFPNWLGMSQVRLASFEGERLVLRTEQPMLVNGQYRTAELVWRRAVEVV
jgi:hypothetical protein